MPGPSPRGWLRLIDLAGFTIEQQGPLVTVKVQLSELTYVTYDEMGQFAEELAQRVHRNRARHFVLDLDSVRFLDSSCMGRLIGLREQVKPASGQIALANCHSNVEMLFRMTRLDALFGLYGSVHEAVKAFGGTSAPKVES